MDLACSANQSINQSVSVGRCVLSVCVIACTCAWLHGLTLYLPPLSLSSMHASFSSCSDNCTNLIFLWRRRRHPSGQRRNRKKNLIIEVEALRRIFRWDAWYPTSQGRLAPLPPPPPSIQCTVCEVFKAKEFVNWAAR